METVPEEASQGTRGVIPGPKGASHVGSMKAAKPSQDGSELSGVEERGAYVL